MAPGTDHQLFETRQPRTQWNPPPTTTPPPIFAEWEKSRFLREESVVRPRRGRCVGLPSPSLLVRLLTPTTSRFKAGRWSNYPRRIEIKNYNIITSYFQNMELVPNRQQPSNAAPSAPLKFEYPNPKNESFFRVIFTSRHFESFSRHFCVIFEPYSRHFRVIFESFLCHFYVISMSYLGYIWVMV